MRYKSSEKTIRGSIYICCRVFGALDEFGETGPKYSKLCLWMKKVTQLHISQVFRELEQSLQTGSEYSKIMRREIQKVFQSFQIRICYQMWLYSSVKAI